MTEAGYQTPKKNETYLCRASVCATPEVQSPQDIHLLLMSPQVAAAFISRYRDFCRQFHKETDARDFLSSMQTEYIGMSLFGQQDATGKLSYLVTSLDWIWDQRHRDVIFYQPMFHKDIKT